jgi:hypothetical protein
MIPVKRKLGNNQKGTQGVGTPDIVPRGAAMGFNTQIPLAGANQAAAAVSPGGPLPQGTTNVIPPFQNIGGKGGQAQGLMIPGGSIVPYKPTIKVLTVSLAVAINGQVVNMPGNIFWVVDSTNSTDRISMQLDTTGTNDYIPVGPGFAIEGTTFAGFILSLGQAATPAIPNPPALVPGAYMTIAVINDPNETIEA